MSVNRFKVAHLGNNKLKEGIYELPGNVRKGIQSHTQSDISGRYLRNEKISLGRKVFIYRWFSFLKPKMLLRCIYSKLGKVLSYAHALTIHYFLFLFVNLL